MIFKSQHLLLKTSLLAFGLFGLPLLFSSPVSALSISDGISLHYNKSSLSSNYLFGDYDLNEHFNYSGEVLWQNLSNALIGSSGLSPLQRWRGFSLQTDETIPGNSLVSFSISYTLDNTVSATGAANFVYNGVQFEDGRTLVFDSCLATNLNMTNLRTFECTYIMWNRYNTTLIQTKGGVHIIEPLGNLSNTATLNLVINAPSAIVLSNDGLSASDRQWLAENIGSSDSTAVVNKIEQLRSDTLAQTRVIQSGNDEAQQRWEDDKQEEADREESGQEDAERLGELFDFNITNPFSGLMTLFTDSCPVSIPTIAGLIGSPSSVYPCWFPQSVRSILTPVIGIFASVVLFGFLVRGFLLKGNFSGGIEI